MLEIFFLGLFRVLLRVSFYVKLCVCNRMYTYTYKLYLYIKRGERRERGADR